MNTLYTKEIDGRKVIKPRRNIILNVIKSIPVSPDSDETEEVNMQTFNPTHEMLIEDGWELYVAPEPTEEELFNDAKRQKILEINNYDSSDEINIFYIQGLPVWLDKATRAGLKLRFEAELAMEDENTTLWYGNQSFTLQLNMAIQMLYAIEVYASKCYDNTQKHLANVEKLETLEEIIEYDYHTGYPEKLNF
jgi:hypothetical protein